jgi:hypothetical protein
MRRFPLLTVLVVPGWWWISTFNAVNNNFTKYASPMRLI